jgi:hypothetical protein
VLLLIDIPTPGYSTLIAAAVLVGLQNFARKAADMSVVLLGAPPVYFSISSNIALRHQAFSGNERTA